MLFSLRAKAAAATIWCWGVGVGKWGLVLPGECAASYTRTELMSICVWPLTGGCIASDTRGPVVISAAAAGGGVCLH